MSKEAAGKADILKKLRDHLSEEGFVKRLGAYCRSKTVGRAWYGQSQKGTVSMAAGNTPEDIVHQAISKTIEGAKTGEGRIWDGERDLFDYLTSVIDSELSNLQRSATNRRLVRAGTLGSDDPADDFLSQVRDQQAQSGEDEMLAAEKEEEANAFVGDFIDSLQGDDFLEGIVGCLIDGMKPREIAEELNVPIKDVYNAKKRIANRLEKFRSTRANQQKEGE